MSDEIQRLPERTAFVCKGCGERVYFVVDQTQPMADGQHRIAYLHCPLCGQKATQVCEIAATRRRRAAIIGGKAVWNFR